MRSVLTVAIVFLFVLTVQGDPRISADQPRATNSPIWSPSTDHVVTSAADSGSGTLRQALIDAQPGDLILFDSAVFPPGSPVTITLTAALPPLAQGDITLDASNAGVLLDGSGILDRGANGLNITSEGNIVRGLQIVNFPNNGIELGDEAKHNIIGGTRSVGSGPLGQGNLVRGNGSHGLSISTAFNTIQGNVVSDNSEFGIGVWGCMYNTFRENFIGTDPKGVLAWGNHLEGVFVDGASHNQFLCNLVNANGANGITLSGASYHNTLSHNIIGTDASDTGSLGNMGSGITIREGASDNIVGPGNHIAHNAGSGVEVRDPGSLNNTVTQNSIHDNDFLGIEIWFQDEQEISRPVVLEYDLGAGRLAGLVEPHATVEVFSTDDHEGRTYEGRTTANHAGWFLFDKGTPLTGSYLTVTATDGAGATSEFSIPTAGASGTWLLQKDNDSAAARYSGLRSNQIADNHIASFWHSLWAYTPLSELLEETVHMGVKHFRLAANSGDVDKVDWSKPEFDVDPEHDQFVTDLAENRIAISYYLTFWDKATYPGGVGAPCPRFKTEEEIQRYLDFAQFIVNYYKDRIQTYEIWNEPDVPICPQYIEVDDYINLVQRAVPVIRKEYPEAKIQVGGTAGLSNPDAQAYLFAILESDAMPLVDVISWHPFYGESPESNPEYYAAYAALVRNMMDVASAHGFDGEYEANESNWRPTWDPDPDHPTDYTETVCAKYFGRGVVLHRGLDVTAGNLRIPHQYAASTDMVRNLATLMASAEPISLPLTVQTSVTDVVSYTFSLPGDAYLVALWRDGIAVDADSGVTATLRIPGQYPDYTMIAVDPLYGLQQEMISEVEAGSLAIPDLVVKDYPLILRLYGPRHAFLPTVLKGFAP